MSRYICRQCITVLYGSLSRWLWLYSLNDVWKRRCYRQIVPGYSVVYNFCYIMCTFWPAQYNQLDKLFNLNILFFSKGLKFLTNFPWVFNQWIMLTERKLYVCFHCHDYADHLVVREHLESRVNLVVKANQSLSLIKGTQKNRKQLVGSLKSWWYIFGGVFKKTG